MKEKTIITLLEKRISATPDDVVISYKEDNKWKSLTWREYGKEIDRISKSLIALGIDPQDKVALMGSNTREWFVCDMAIMVSGAVSVPIYGTSSSEQMQYILNHSECKVLIIDNIEFFNRIREQRSKIPLLKNIVFMNSSKISSNGWLMNQEEFLSAGGSLPDEKLFERRSRVTPDYISSHIYTSGTTGYPKAVMLSHKNCVAAAENVYLTAKIKVKPITCSYLPLSHVAERVINLYSPMLTGSTIYLMGGYENFAAKLKEIRPTAWAGVPRVWEKIYEGVMKYKETLPEGKKRVIEWALRAGSAYNWKKYKGELISLPLSIKYSFARLLVIKKLLRSMGLDRVATTVTGGAPTSGEILDFFMSIGIWLQDVYGQTEGHGTTSFATLDSIRFGSAGKPYPLVEVKIADDGEILVKGDNVSPGYYKDPELTRETFKDGWLYSGDQGYIDKDGFLWITGRKKDIIITSGGKNITPSKIESALMSNPLIEHAVVVGDGKKYLCALLTINREYASGMNAALSSNGKEVAEDPVINNAIKKHINEINTHFSRVEQVKKYKILPSSFTVEEGELTHTQKVKRSIIIKKYEKEINGMYRDPLDE